MSSIVLFPNQYIHVLNEDDGTVRTEVGPSRVVLKANERLLTKKACVVVGEDQYVIIQNPLDPKTGKCRIGDREVIVGPRVLALAYDEVIEGEIQSVHLLGEGQALQLQMIVDHEDRPAGFMWQEKGPKRFVPSKYERIVRQLNVILINQNEAIYVQDVETAKMKMIRGPCAYLLAVNEELYNKPYSEWEISALGLDKNPSYWATVIHLEKGEMLCVLNYESNQETVIMGPSTYILGPQEGVKVLSISAGKPKKNNALKIAKVRKGPDFMSDIFQVRTKDNAQLRLHITYKWEFLVDNDDAHKVFALNDFIGYSCHSLCSAIREEAAQHNFEDFHNSTVKIIRAALFKPHTIEFSNGAQVVVQGKYFDEVKFLVSEIDVKEITPVNEEISSLLNQSIKSNMIIVCKKMEQEANLTAQKEKVTAEAEIQRLRETLIDIENENLKLERIETARIDGQALIETTRAQKDSAEIKANSRLALDSYETSSVIDLLAGPTGERYIEFLRLRNFSQIPQNWVVPTNSTIQLPVGQPIHH